MPKSVTLKTVAEAANVSKTTVSLALRNHPKISKATCERVQKIAEELDYSPDPLATSLGRRKNVDSLQSNIACIVGHKDRHPLGPHHPAYLSMFAGAKERAAQMGFQLNDFWRYDPQKSEKQIEKILQTRGINGIILLALSRNEINLDWNHYATAYLGFFSYPMEFSSVNASRDLITRMALRNVIAQGYKRIGIAINENIGGPESEIISSYLHCRYSNPQLTLLDPFLFTGGPNETESKRFLDWYHSNKPEVIITRQASARNHPVKTWLEDAQVKIPGELSLADLNVTEPNSTLTGVIPPYEKIGAATIDIVNAQLYRNELGFIDNPQYITSYPDWNEGNTLPKK